MNGCEKVGKYIPNYLAKSIYDIDYVKLYDNGKRIILFDLDNTLAPYDDVVPTEKQIELNTVLRKLGFKIYIISNNHQNRTKLYTNTFVVDDYLVLAHKPFTYKIKRFLKKKNINYNESIWIGDQLLTDISCANKLEIESVLVSSISRSSEKWYTKMNRKREKKVLKKIAKTNLELSLHIEEIITKKVK